MKDEAQILREIIKNSVTGVTEQIKWKAPSYVYSGDDRITFNFSHKKNIRIILHRGVAVKDASKFEFKDPSGLVVWKTKDRGQLEFSGPDEIAENLGRLKKLFKNWFQYTAEMD